MTALPADWRARVDALAALGLGAVGVADGVPFQDWLPGCRSVLVVGSGGPALWQAMVEEIRVRPEALTDTAHPLDDFVRRCLQQVDPDPPATRRWALADARQRPYLPVQRLALAAGLGWSSRLQLILSPVYGPWMGLRAACFTTESLPVDGPLPGEGPCGDCPAPCRSACPGRAMKSERLDWRWCTVHRAGTRDCLEQCHARAACPQGAAHRYPPLEHVFHHDKARGRRALAQALGIDDPEPPRGTDWAAAARSAWELIRGRGEG